MPVHVALLRAVNVGGRTCRMADLRAHLTEAGFTDVETHIQTGNVRVRSSLRSSAAVGRRIEEVLAERCGFDVPAVVVTTEELRQSLEDALRLPVATPAEGVVQRRYVSYFKPGDVPTGEVAEQLAAWDAPGESAAVVGRCVHVCLEGPTQDAAVLKRFRKALAPGTSRDLKVVTAMVERWCGPARG